MRQFGSSIVGSSSSSSAWRDGDSFSVVIDLDLRQVASNRLSLSHKMAPLQFWRHFFIALVVLIEFLLGHRNQPANELKA